MMSLGAIVCGFLLDLAIGDPHGWPHPIILIGNLISTLEKKVRAVSGTDPGKLLHGGFVLVLIVCVLSFFIPFLILYGAGMIDPWLRFILETIMCYQIFCTRSLRDESMKVYDVLGSPRPAIRAKNVILDRGTGYGRTFGRRSSKRRGGNHSGKHCRRHFGSHAVYVHWRRTVSFFI